jgi:hypothetical protein
MITKEREKLHHRHVLYLAPVSSSLSFFNFSLNSFCVLSEIYPQTLNVKFK